METFTRLHVNLILLVFTFASSSARVREKRIIGGNLAQPGEFTYTVALVDKGKIHCSGGIIGDQFILTAGHCVAEDDKSFDVKTIWIMIGADDLSKCNQDNKFYVEKVYLSKMYQMGYILEKYPNYHHADIAVLKLKRKINFNVYPPIQKLNLPPAEVRIDSLIGKNAIVSGFGVNEIHVIRDMDTDELIECDQLNYNRLHYAETTIFSNAKCSLTESLHDSDICAQVTQISSSMPRGVCSADSGGPLVYQGSVIIGVQTFGPIGCNEFDRPAIYASVWHYLKFINNAVADRVTQDMRTYENTYCV